MAPADGLAPSQRVRRASLSDTVYERLRDEIIRGEIEDGVSLSQASLAERYGVSRIPVREALRRLQAESLVVATPFHPFVVRNISSAQVLELVGIRAALEELALQHRAVPSAAEVSEFRTINRQMARSTGREWLARDRALHSLMLGASPMTVEIIDDVRDRITLYSNRLVVPRPGRAKAAREHGVIIDALEAGDVDAARDAMRAHVMSFRDFVAERLGTTTPDPG